MTDTPGWASPGSSPSGEPDRDGAAPDDGTPPQPAPGAPEATAPPNWSKQQPPAAQWSAPIGGPTPPPLPPPGPGWGAPGGWQPTPWGKPPAAKPGVIPLRPLGVGEILDGAVSTMRAHWRTALGISLAVALVTQTATILLQRLLLIDADPGAPMDPNADPGEVVSTLANTFAASSLALLISVIGTIIATAMLTMVVSRAVLGRPVTSGEAWRNARPRLLRLLALTFLLILISAAIVGVPMIPGILLMATGADTGGAALTVLGGIVGVVIMIWVIFRYNLAAPALMLEKQGIFKAMARSAKLVRGSWWRVFGIQLLTMILVTVVSSIIAIPFTIVAMLFGGDGLSAFSEGETGTFGWSFLIITGIGAVIGSTITLPISAGVTTLLYVDQRIRREALDIELARAAGIPGYDAPQAPPSHPSDSTTPGS